MDGFVQGRGVRRTLAHLPEPQHCINLAISRDYLLFWKDRSNRQLPRRARLRLRDREQPLVLGIPCTLAMLADGGF
ncbi:hypothetical protein THIOKS11020003 [Thiocapsa sp. KS1]|nr:hypothetical protein THIOKS11020003 [Thiocapsa sp. KS1]